MTQCHSPTHPWLPAKVRTLLGVSVPGATLTTTNTKGEANGLQEGHRTPDDKRAPSDQGEEAPSAEFPAILDQALCSLDANHLRSRDSRLNHSTPVPAAGSNHGPEIGRRPDDDLRQTRLAPP